ncbi:uncharacterized protein [Ptychodera flava]|uniref:uncharacterized protein n=1 Tax=Ptychodera flava TaxID=63121 RepID=UPI00396A0855
MTPFPRRTITNPSVHSQSAIMDCKLSSDSKTAHCTFNDLSQFDQEKTGKLDPVGLLTVIRQAVESGWSMHDTFGLAASISKDANLFLIANCLDIYPLFYSNFSTQMPAQCDVSVVYVGRTSIVHEVSFKIKESGEVLATSLALAVFVNLESRRPRPWPESFTNAYIEKTTVQKPSIHVQFARLPPSDCKLYCHKTVVSSGDIDMNNHVGNPTYIKYCMDCATFGARDKAYTLIKGDLADYPITCITYFFFNESLLHDELMVTSWEDRAKPFKLYFSIRTEEKDIMQCTFTFNVRHVGSNL